MRKSNASILLLVGVVALYQNPAFALGIPNRSEAPRADVMSEPELHSSEEKAEVKTEPKKIKKEKQTLSLIEDEEFRKLGLSLEFIDKKLQLTGELASACADRLSIDVKRFASEESDEPVKVESEDDAQSSAAKLGVRVSFHGNKDIKSISDCVTQQEESEEEKVNLRDLSKLGYSVKAEPALAGLLDASGKVALGKESAESFEYKQLVAAIKVAGCKNCGADSAALRKKIDALQGLKPEVVSSLMGKLFDSSVESSEAKITKAKGLRQLETIRSELAGLAQDLWKLKIPKSEQEDKAGKISALYLTLITRSEELSEASKSTNDLNRTADFIEKTYRELAALPKMDEDSRKLAEELAGSYSKKMNKEGDDRRAEFLSSHNPSHPYVTELLQRNEFKKNTLQREAQLACAGSSNQFNFTKCSDAQNKIMTLNGSMIKLQGRVDAAKSVEAALAQQALILQQSNSHNGANPAAANFAGANANQFSNRMFNLDSRVFPNSAEYNRYSGVDSQYTYKNPIDLVYNQGFSPMVKNSNLSLNTNGSATPIQLNASGDLPVPTMIQKSAAPTFRFES